MKKTYDVYMTELVTYKKTIQASSHEEALELAQSDYGAEDAVSHEYYADDISELSQ